MEKVWTLIIFYGLKISVSKIFHGLNYLVLEILVYLKVFNTKVFNANIFGHFKRPGLIASEISVVRNFELPKCFHTWNYAKCKIFSDANIFENFKHAKSLVFRSFYSKIFSAWNHSQKVKTKGHHFTAWKCNALLMKQFT